MIGRKITDQAITCKVIKPIPINRYNIYQQNSSFKVQNNANYNDNHFTNKQANLRKDIYERNNETVQQGRVFGGNQFNNNNVQIDLDMNFINHQNQINRGNKINIGNHIRRQNSNKISDLLFKKQDISRQKEILKPQKQSSRNVTQFFINNKDKLINMQPNKRINSVYHKFQNKTTIEKTQQNSEVSDQVSTTINKNIRQNSQLLKESKMNKILVKETKNGLTGKDDKSLNKIRNQKSLNTIVIYTKKAKYTPPVSSNQIKVERNSSKTKGLKDKQLQNTKIQRKSIGKSPSLRNNSSKVISNKQRQSIENKAAQQDKTKQIQLKNSKNQYEGIQADQQNNKHKYMQFNESNLNELSFGQNQIQQNPHNNQQTALFQIQNSSITILTDNIRTNITISKPPNSNRQKYLSVKQKIQQQLKQKKQKLRQQLQMQKQQQKMQRQRQRLLRLEKLELEKAQKAQNDTKIDPQSHSHNIKEQKNATNSTHSHTNNNNSKKNKINTEQATNNTNKNNSNSVPNKLNVNNQKPRNYPVNIKNKSQQQQPILDQQQQQFQQQQRIQIPKPIQNNFCPEITFNKKIIQNSVHKIDGDQKNQFLNISSQQIQINKNKNCLLGLVNEDQPLNQIMIKNEYKLQPYEDYQPINHQYAYNFHNSNNQNINIQNSEYQKQQFQNHSILILDEIVKNQCNEYQQKQGIMYEQSSSDQQSNDDKGYQQRNQEKKQINTEQGQKNDLKIKQAHIKQTKTVITSNRNAQLNNNTKGTQYNNKNSSQFIQNNSNSGKQTKTTVVKQQNKQIKQKQVKKYISQNDNKTKQEQQQLQDSEDDQQQNQKLRQYLIRSNLIAQNKNKSRHNQTKNQNNKPTNNQIIKINTNKNNRHNNCQSSRCVEQEQKKKPLQHNINFPSIIQQTDQQYLQSSLVVSGIYQNGSNQINQPNISNIEFYNKYDVNDMQLRIQQIQDSSSEQHESQQQQQQSNTDMDIQSQYVKFEQSQQSEYKQQACIFGNSLLKSNINKKKHIVIVQYIEPKDQNNNNSKKLQNVSSSQYDQIFQLNLQSLLQKQYIDINSNISHTASLDHQNFRNNLNNLQ